MSALKAAAVESALSQKGFDVQHGKHRQFRLVVDGLATGVATHTSHNAQEIDDFLAMMMARQLHLTKGDFLRLVECSMSGKEYLEQMVRNGFVVLARTTTLPEGKQRRPSKRR